MKPLRRASDRYATTFAAGALGAKYGILPWSRKALLRAILTCQLDQLRYIDEGRDAPSSVENPLAKLTQYLKDNRRNFINLNKKRPRYGREDLDAAPGYRTKIDGQSWYYVTSKQLKAIIGTGNDARALKQELAEKGLMEKNKRQGKFVVQRRIFKGGKGGQNHAWVHAIKADILRDENAVQ